MSGFFVSPSNASTSSTTIKSTDASKPSAPVTYTDILKNTLSSNILTITIVVGLIALSLYIYYYGDKPPSSNGATVSSTGATASATASKTVLDGLHNYLTNPQYSDRMEMV